MAQVTEKLNQDVVERIKATQDEQNSLIIKLGQLRYKQHRLETELSTVETDIFSSVNSIDESIKKLNGILDELDKDYPNGLIDVENGTISYNKD